MNTDAFTVITSAILLFEVAALVCCAVACGFMLRDEMRYRRRK